MKRTARRSPRPTHGSPGSTSSPFRRRSPTRSPGISHLPPMPLRGLLSPLPPARTPASPAGKPGQQKRLSGCLSEDSRSPGASKNRPEFHAAQSVGRSIGVGGRICRRNLVVRSRKPATFVFGGPGWEARPIIARWRDALQGDDDLTWSGENIRTNPVDCRHRGEHVQFL